MGLVSLLLQAQPRHLLPPWRMGAPSAEWAVVALHLAAGFLAVFPVYLGFRILCTLNAKPIYLLPVNKSQGGPLYGILKLQVTRNNMLK